MLRNLAGEAGRWRGAPVCRRRRRALAPLARGILLGQAGGRALTAAAWLSLVALGALFAQSAALGWLILPSLCLFVALCAVALFDARYFVIPDGPLLCLGLCGLATSLLLSPQETAARLAAAAAGYVAIRGVALAYEALRGAPGVGEGDASLFAVAGLWLGFEGLPGCLIYATLSALLAAAIALREGTLENARAPLPFGPHLALGLWLAWVFGPLEFG
ncbi:A24 family peptidase [Methylocystis sp. IM3]|uniref:prepilin peptidase n=1 Tax=unclassified Methylocystis TaxID=2625913 RepID=UPI000FC1DB4E|nr:MAG: prepilin peptidase [Hyphomicrobiales bacterium]